MSLRSTCDGHFDDGSLNTFNFHLETNQCGDDVHAVSLYDKWCVALKSGRHFGLIDIAENKSLPQ